MKKAYKNWFYVLVGLLGIMLLMTSCSSKPTIEETGGDELIWGTAPDETKGIEVQTDYFTFQYPKEWENKVEETRTEDGENCIVTFRTVISNQEIVLFSVVLGPDDAEGYLLGQLNNGEETINVYTAVNDMPAEDWSQEEYDEICSLQERINEIIMQFHEDDRFVPNR